MLRLKSPAPDVRLVNAFERPMDGAVAAARTCYSAKGIVSPEEVGGDALEDEAERRAALERRDALARDIYAAGHHTNFQHAHFEFAIDRISRHALWSFFHAHPFYNSEQVSQRYVKVKRGTALIPELPADAAALYERTLERLEAAYRGLCKQLEPVAASVYFETFKARSRHPEKWKKEIRRKAQEAARYVLPVATWARLYHTVSTVTLMRYRRLAEQLDVPSEVRMIVDAMSQEVLRVDPGLAAVFEEPLPLEESPEARALAGLGGVLVPERAEAFAEEFDEELEGRVSRLVGYSVDAEKSVARAVREVLGLPRAALGDDDALALAADPGANALYGESLNLTTVSKLTRALHHAHYTFRRKISHTADSQDQRHRMTPASRPVLLAQLRDAPDVIHPSLLHEDDAAKRVFDDAMAELWETLFTLRRMGVDEEAIGYLLPNAVAVRYTESGDFSALRHKHAMRLCYNAQEEIWRASRDEAAEIRAVHPRLGAFLLPPCSMRLRSGATPICPEGRRYCGVPVWKLPLEKYERRL